MIASRQMMHTDNGKAALTLSNPTELLGQFLDFFDNAKNKKAYLGHEVLHLKKKEKSKLVLNFLLKLPSL